MGFVKRDIKDRVVQYPYDATIEDAPGRPGVKRIIRSPGKITESGTDANKAQQQPIEDALHELYGESVAPIAVTLESGETVKSTNETLFNTPAYYTQKGLTLVNSVVNGQFKDGTSDWVESGGSVEIVDGEVIVTTTTTGGLRQDLSANVGDEIVIVTRSKSTGNYFHALYSSSGNVVSSTYSNSEYEIRCSTLTVEYTDNLMTYLRQGESVTTHDADFGVFVINKTQSGLGDYLASIGLVSDEQQEEWIINVAKRGYFEGMQSSQGVKVESKNDATTPTEQSYHVLPHKLASLQNLVSDEYDSRTGIITANTVVGLDGDFYALKESDITAITDLDNVQRIEISKKTNDIVYNQAIISNSYILAGYKTHTDGTFDSVDSYNTLFSNQSTTKYRLAVPLGTYASLGEVQADLVGTKLIYQIATPVTINTGLVGTISSYTDYTQFSVESGVIEGELVILSESATTYYLNIVGHSTIPDSPLNSKVRKINSIVFDGVDIKDLGTITNDDLAYGDERWYIQKSVIETNNIDINNIRVDYITLETCPAGDIVIECSNSLAEAHNDTVQEHTKISKQVDVNTKSIQNSIGYLGAKAIEELSVTTAGYTNWSNPVGITRTEIYQSRFDMTGLNYQQLKNSCTLYNAGTNEYQQLTVDSDTTYFAIPVTIYTVGGKEYKAIGKVVSFTTPNEQFLYNNGTQVVDWFVSGSASFESTYMRITNTGGIVYSEIVNFTPYNNMDVQIEITGTGTAGVTYKVTSTPNGGSTLLSDTESLSAGTSKTKTIDISALTSGSFNFEMTSRSDNPIIEIFVVRLY